MKEKILELHKKILFKKAINQSCEIETELLVKAFDPIIRCIAKNFYLKGGDSEDLLQEGRIGLCKAIDTYDEQKNGSFMTYASACIRNSMIDIVRKQNSTGNKSINESISINDLQDDFEADSLAPDDVMIEKELVKTIRKELSEYQNKVLDLYLEGYSYEQIANQLEKSSKSIDNCIQKIKKTLKGTIS